jgi:predicted N-acetyltransferase YhbS
MLTTYPKFAMQVETLDRRAIAEPDLRAIAELLDKVFTKRGVETRMQRLTEEWQTYTGPEAMYPRSFVIREDGRTVAHAAALPRLIGTSEGDLTVLGLVHVCTDPDARGHKLGQAVVRAAFDLVDHGPYEHALFQTSNSVRGFYEKLGAGIVTNRIINSTSADPYKNPFWDDVVMRYPAAKHWPAGDIDLRSPGW